MADCLAKPARASPKRSCIYAWAAFLSKPDSHPQASAGLGGFVEPHRSISASSASQWTDSLTSNVPGRSSFSILAGSRNPALHPGPGLSPYPLYRSIETAKGRPCIPRSCVSAQSCLTLCGPVDCSPPGSSVHRILQEGIPEQVASPCSGASS